MLHGWLLLLLSLPPRPSSLRVRAWRRLRGLGAVPLRSSAYLLPDSPDRYEQFQWLAQEIQRDGGEATLLRVDRIENMQRPDVVRLFQEARNQDYAALAERYRKLLKGRRPRLAEELARLAREMGRITEIDFFEAPGRREVERAREAVEERTAPGRARPAGAAPPLDLAALKGRRWVTRPRPHVDRIASAWLIKRFVDPEAEFVFAPPIRFPATRSRSTWPAWTSDITARTARSRPSCAAPGSATASSAILAEIVHEADIKDRKFAREEARGIDLALRALLSAIKDDQEALAQGMTLFDGLYTTDRGASMSEPRTTWGLVRYFLYLGSLGFGGPVALVGYMQRDLVERRALVHQAGLPQGPGALAARARAPRRPARHLPGLRPRRGSRAPPWSGSRSSSPPS